MPDSIGLWLLVAILLVVAYLIFRIIKYNGILGALVGGRITKTYGEVVGLRKSGLFKAKVGIHRVSKDGKNRVVVVIVMTSSLGYKMLPVILPREDANRLKDLIGLAAIDAQ